MNRHQVNTLFEILAGLQIGDNKVEPTLQTAMNEFYETLIANREGNKRLSVVYEIEKKVELLSWKALQALRNKHKKEMTKIEKNRNAPPPSNEKEYTIAKVAKELKMTPQNLNKHLEKHPEVKVKTLSPRKRYITETELNRLKKILGINK
jgi:hypothetical protein